MNRRDFLAQACALAAASFGNSRGRGQLIAQRRLRQEDRRHRHHLHPLQPRRQHRHPLHGGLQHRRQELSAAVPGRVAVHRAGRRHRHRPAAGQAVEGAAGQDHRRRPDAGRRQAGGRRRPHRRRARRLSRSTRRARSSIRAGVSSRRWSRSSAPASASVPVFNDKHLAYTWNDAKWMYDQRRELGFPMMAGSSVPVTWRRPDLQPEIGIEWERALSVGYGHLLREAFGFHTLEGLQVMTERRKGGETGVKAVQYLEGKEAWEAARPASGTARCWMRPWPGSRPAPRQGQDRGGRRRGDRLPDRVPRRPAGGGVHVAAALSGVRLRRPGQGQG